MLYCRPPTGDLLGPTVRGVVDRVEVSVHCCIVVYCLYCRPPIAEEVTLYIYILLYCRSPTGEEESVYCCSVVLRQVRRSQFIAAVSSSDR